jgi:hypothetical protein
MTDSNSALAAVMDQAAQASSQFQAPVPAQMNGGSAVQQYAPVQRPSLDSMADSSGIIVDAYLTAKDAGFKIDKGAYFKEFKATIDILECAPILSVRATTGGNTTFIKSYDGVMTSQGENFQQAVSRLTATSTKVDGPYQTVEIPVTLLQDVDGAKKGQRLGITPAITGVKFWTAFYNELRQKNLTGAKVEVLVKHKYMTNKNGNEWGVAEFELIKQVER